MTLDDSRALVNRADRKGALVMRVAEETTDAVPFGRDSALDGLTAGATASCDGPQPNLKKIRFHVFEGRMRI